MKHCSIAVLSTDVNTAKEPKTARHYVDFRVLEKREVIIMQCYHCMTKTLAFNEATRLWTCCSCGQVLTTPDAIEQICQHL